jgi:Ca-activated chloride channel homolog
MEYTPQASKTLKALLLGLMAAAAVMAAAPQDAHAIGLMIPKTGDRPFDIEYHRAEVTITGTAAVTKIEQVFRNNTDRPMEATFIFPIPEGATVSDFSLWIEGKKTAGAVLEKDEARAIYESIVRRTKDPGLIEYMDGKLFRASIFPIPAGGTQKLEIKFGQVLVKQGGMYSFSYPVSVGRDYVTAKTNKDFTLTARIQQPLPITSVYSPTHKIGVQRKSSTEVVLGTEEMNVELDRDFQLFIGLSKQDIGLNILTHDPDGDGGEPGYFMMAIAPRVDVAAHEEIGQTFSFVMDTSGSMAGEKIDQARQTLAFCLGRLKPQDRFNVIRFSTDVEALHENPVAATPEAIKQAIAFAKALEPAGGTAIGPALDRALEQRTSKDQPHQIIFVTDGIPTVGNTETSQILQMVKTKTPRGARVFVFGVGYDVNTPLLDGIAVQARGRADYVKPTQNLENAVAALYRRISSPVLSDIQIDFGGAKVYDTYPSPIPDLFQGDQVVLFGRFRTGFNAPITVSGKAGPETKKYTFGKSADDVESKKREVSSAVYQEPLEFLPKLWATRKVGYLLEQIRLNGEQPELKTEVIMLAKKFGLVTPYTSFLAVDDSEFGNNNNRPTPDDRPRPEPRRRGDQIDDLVGGGFGDESSEGDGGLRGPRAQGSGKGSGRGQNKPAEAAPAAPKAVATKKAEAQSRAFDKGFKADVGEDAVAASEATRDYKEKERMDGKSGGRTYVAGRTFEIKGGVWVQDGLDAGDKKAEVVESYSARYFELLRKHKELKTVLTLGDQVVVKIDGKVYRFTPAKTK